MGESSPGAVALPFLTTIHGVGGIIRQQPEDFRVVERPLYLPCGEGEHLYLKVTKRGLSTPDLITYLSGTLGIKARCIGVAGLKDARAVTTQMVSVQGVNPDRLRRVRLNEKLLAVEVLGRHRNRLRTGHHNGNLFEIVVRDVDVHAETPVRSIMEELSRRGVPNYFGPQRQGRAGSNYRTGAALLHGEQGRGRMTRQQRLWALHAYQAFLFNRMVALRIDRIDRVFAGDWAMKHANGACFMVENPEVDQARADRFEISPTGVLFGSRAPWASGEPGVLERQAVAELGETPEALTRAAAEHGFRGERRPLRVPMEEWRWSISGRDLTLVFALPPGAYATSVLREVMKKDG